MLKHLYIKNYALIDELDLDLHQGFSVITGETGAGKSIILGALGLLLGNRADVRDIQKGAKKCAIEGTFGLDGFHLDEFFNQNDFDFENQECTIRREMISSGKSRAFINDTPATQAQLRVLGASIIDIHSQHQNLMLSNETFQLDMLDLMASSIAQREVYVQCYQHYVQLGNELQALRKKAEEARQNQDYLTFQWQQLADFNPQPGEDEQLEQESQTLQHAEEIKSVLFQTDEMLSNEENGVLPALRRCYQSLSSLQCVYADSGEWSERLENAYIDIKDICSDLSAQAEHVEYSPERLQEVTQRLDALYSLQQKHHVDSAAALAELMNSLRVQLDEVQGYDEQMEAARQAFHTCEGELLKLAEKLTATRQKAAAAVEQRIVDMLIPLGIAHPQVKVDIQPLPKPSPLGMDRVTLLFSANKNSPLHPIAEVASGGEIARVMLSIKVMLAGAKQMPTIIFDEIDTGVSGRIAECMANMMQEMSRHHGTQVISITHLPQIAAQGDVHYKVYKQDNDTQTTSHIACLSTDERVREIANMLSGAEVTAAAIENAKQLLKK